MKLFPWIKPKIKLRIIERSSSTLRLHEWRSDKDLVMMAQKVFLDPNFRMMLDVCRNENPSSFVLDINAPEHVRASYQSKTEGYMMALTNLEAMSRFNLPEKQLEPTFEPE